MLNHPILTSEINHETKKNREISIDIFGKSVKISVSIANRNVAPETLMSLFQKTSDIFATASIENAREQGKVLSCTKKCSACCKQLIPLSLSEVVQIRKIVEDMPQRKAQKIRSRFKQIRALIGNTEFLTILKNSMGRRADKEALGYFNLNLLCPFLEKGLCSIYEDRPLVCREYNVTNSRLACESPTAKSISRISLDSYPSIALRLTEKSLFGINEQKIPLINALDQSIQPPGDWRSKSSLDIVDTFFSYIKDYACFY